MLELKSLSKSFQGLQVFQGIDMTISFVRGQKPPLVGLIGPNGAGKTTLFNILTGYEKADCGTILFENKRIDGKKPFEIVKFGLGRTFQSTLTFKDMTVRENVLVASYLSEKFNFLDRFIYPFISSRFTANKNEKANRKVEAILELVGLNKEMNTVSGYLPYGKQKKLGIAMAVATDPKLLALDEPAAGLNPGEAAEMISLLRRINQSGTALLVIEHNMKLVMNLCERVYVLSEGKMIAEDTPEAIARNPKVIEVYLGKGMAANAQ